MVTSARKRPATQIAGNNSHQHDSMSTGVVSALEAGAHILAPGAHALLPEYESTSTLTSTTKKTRGGRKKKDKRSKKLKEDGSNGNNASLAKDGSSLET